MTTSSDTMSTGSAGKTESDPGSIFSLQEMSRPNFLPNNFKEFVDTVSSACDNEEVLKLVADKLNEIIDTNCKNKLSPRSKIKLLQHLQILADQHRLGVAVEIKIKLGLISSILNYNIEKPHVPLHSEYWTKLLQLISETLDLLLSTPDIAVRKLANNESLKKPPYCIRGCLFNVVKCLDEEFIKQMKNCNPHGNTYSERLSDEKRIVMIIDKVTEFLELQSQKVPTDLCRIYFKKVEYLYYKFDPHVLKQKQGEISQTEVTSEQIMDKLCKFICSKDESARLKAQVILFQGYHHALHDNWCQARDLILMSSDLEKFLKKSSPQTQILYNRTLAQLGLCAFRLANFTDALYCLETLIIHGKMRNMLAQEVLTEHERIKDYKKIARQTPLYMHINLELLECVYIVSAMIIEIPYMAAHDVGERRKITKTFYQKLKSSEKQPLVGKPQSVDEHVIAASKAMRNGNWSLCKNLIINEKMNLMVWDFFHESAKLKEMLVRVIKEETLRTYVFTHSKSYDSISIETLSIMFEMNPSTVNSIIRQMIISGELEASLDDSTQIAAMHREESNRIESRDLMLSDGVNNSYFSKKAENSNVEVELGDSLHQGNTGNSRQNTYKLLFDYQEKRKNAKKEKARAKSVKQKGKKDNQKPSLIEN